MRGLRALKRVCSYRLARRDCANVTVFSQPQAWYSIINLILIYVVVIVLSDVLRFQMQRKGEEVLVTML